jgi:CRP-like cAMP-binding protein
VRQLELTERIMRLRSVPIFRGVATTDLAPVAASMRSRSFEKGEIIIREDAPPRVFFLTTLGTITMRRKGKHIGTVRAPGGVGFLSVLARTAGGTESIAETYTEGYEVTADAIEEMLEDHFSVFLGALRWVSERMLIEHREARPPPYVPPAVPFDHLIGDRELGIVERIFILRRSRALAVANVNSVARVARRMQEVRVPAGTVLWRPDDVADFSLYVMKGMLELRWKDGASVQKVGPGFVVGGAESLIGHPRWNELVASDPVVLLKGPREVLLDMMEDDHEAAIGFMSMLARGLMSIWDRKAEAGIAAVGTARPSEVPPAPPSAPSAA